MPTTTDAVDPSDQPLRGFHNPLFSTNNGVAAAPNDSRLFPAAAAAEEQSTSKLSSKLSSMVMKRHGRKDGRKDGGTVDITRQRTGEQQARYRKAASEKQMKRLSSVDMPACVVVKSGDAIDAGEVLQHCAFRMDTFRVHDKTAPDAVSFMFVFNSGEETQAALDVTHTRRPTSAGLGSGSGSRSDGGEERVKMTLGGMNVPHMSGEPHSCHIRQVGTVTFNPRKQAKGSYLYILSQEGRTLFTSLT